MANQWRVAPEDSLLPVWVFFVREIPCITVIVVHVG
jgi:hypothetical protein